jgi:hypothetical protein
VRDKDFRQSCCGTEIPIYVLALANALTDYRPRLGEIRLAVIAAGNGTVDCADSGCFSTVTVALLIHFATFTLVPLSERITLLGSGSATCHLSKTGPFPARPRRWQGIVDKTAPSASLPCLHWAYVGYRTDEHSPPWRPIRGALPEPPLLGTSSGPDAARTACQVEIPSRARRSNRRINLRGAMQRQKPGPGFVIRSAKLGEEVGHIYSGATLSDRRT